MKTKFGNALAALSMIGALVSTSSSVVAAQPIDTPEIRTAAQNAATRGDHESIAKYYENTAAQMQAKLTEQKDMKTRAISMAGKLKTSNRTPRP